MTANTLNFQKEINATSQLIEGLKKVDCRLKKDIINIRKRLDRAVGTLKYAHIFDELIDKKIILEQNTRELNLQKRQLNILKLDLNLKTILNS